MPDLQNTLGSRVLLFDGAMGTQIHDRELDLEADYHGCENCTDILTATRPDVIQEIHEAYFAAGADIVETDTFGSMPHVLVEFDLQDRAYELSKAGAQIARRAADACSTADRPRFVAGSMGPGTKLITLGHIAYDELLASYRVAAEGLIDGGADLLLLETCQDILQVKVALQAILDALQSRGRSPDELPIFINVTIETTGTMLAGTAIEAVTATLKNYPIASLGLNCATGPTEMHPHLSHLSKHWPGHVACLPNAGLPVLVDGRTEYPLRPEPFAKAMVDFAREFGLAAVGGCCGTTPAHIAALAKALGQTAPTARTIDLIPPACTSLYSATEFKQDLSILTVGERCNSSGSRKFKRLLEEEDWDGVVALAREQVRESSHVLDINVDYAGRDNASDMHEVVTRLVRQADAPLMLDSTQIATIEAGLRAAPGKCIINSANFEEGEDKFDEFCRLAKRFNAALVIGTIDEDPEHAMARTADRKLEIATRAIERATTHHSLPIGDLFIDPLVLPVSTGMDTDRRSALELIEGTRRIAEAFPEVQITCGLSNASFGLNPAARQVINSVLLYELTQAGMTSAIVHASKILPLNKISDEHRDAALHLIYDRRDQSIGGTGLPEGVTDPDFDPLQHLIELFADVTAAADTGPKLEDLPLEEKLRRHIVDGQKEHLADTLDEAMTQYPPLAIINDHLLDGMKTVGELFGSGQMQLPFVLQSAETMKAAVAHLEPHMEKSDGASTKGSIVLATVRGDVHDIGKNLVDIILTNNGYTVHNIGIKQPIANILKAFDETKADAIGLSGLLVKSVNVMEENLHEFNKLGLRVPVILGGAALTRTYAEGYLRGVYDGPLLYGKDAFEGLRLMDHISTGTLAPVLEAISTRQAKHEESRKAHDKLKAEKAAAAELATDPSVATLPARSLVARDNILPEIPFLGSRVVENIPLADVFAYINPTALFAVQWQMKRGTKSKADYQAELEDKAHPVFERLKAQAVEQNLLHPKLVYGYFPVSSSGEDLIVFDPDDHDREIERFTFPRQPEPNAGSLASKKGRLCISDFFRDLDECQSLGRRDILGLSCVTVGAAVSVETTRLFESDQYQEYLYLHGLGVESAEALAELWHKRMRQELGFGHDDAPTPADLFKQKYRGSRYSFGYAACPDMADQDKLWRLIDPSRIGCALTENHQIDPEQSTSALVVHHPQAKYFNA
ncbi:MAG: 5-methyltetrahydrofolate--homocysteine methyltransferase [Phycisphaerales bacterium]|jgi:5-methyltetrahydrofolate--homocysteine methyltransferase